MEIAGVIRTCQRCQREHETPPAIRLKYCSWACFQAARAAEQVPCVHCGTVFSRHRCYPNRRFCSRSCAMSIRNATGFNPAKVRDITGDKNPMYGKGFRGPDNPMYGKTGSASPRWKGGRKVRKDGYVIVVAPPGHPFPCDKSPSGTAYILEHRAVMEGVLGRFLTPEEVVHHRDGNPSNNSPGNLQLFASKSEHMLLGHPKASSV